MPKTASVSVGESIMWHNADKVAHMPVSGNSAHPDGIFNAGLIDPGADSSAVMIHHPGEVAYFCQIHPYIIGRLQVH